jgi:hypothetical protein
MGFFGSSTPEIPETPEISETPVAIEVEVPDDVMSRERSNVMCTWADSGVYKFRLRQLEIINHAIEELSEELWKDKNLFSSKKAQELQLKVINYKDIDNQPSPNHNWELVSEDPFFYNKEARKNRFKEFENYFMTSGGRDASKMYDDFQNFLNIFTINRNDLMTELAESCKPPQSGGRWLGRGGGRRPISRKYHRY